MSDAVLAIDYGTVRIGVAICEELGLPALPLTTIAHRSFAADAVSIASLADERAATTIVVGYPLRLDGAEGPAAKKIGRLVAELRKVFSGVVEVVDERLTSAAADEKLAATGLSGSKRRRVLDRYAAVEILESYLVRFRNR